MNLRLFVSNQPTNKYDILGLWGEDMHLDLTRNIALSQNLPPDILAITGPPMIEDCARRIARWNNGVDNYIGTSAVLFPEFHFDLTVFGTRFICGRDCWFRRRWQNAENLLNRADEIWRTSRDRNATNAIVREALHSVGEALHSLQDGRSHSEAHNAQSPLWHAPDLLCPIFDPLGLTNACNRAVNGDNFADLTLPDNAQAWPEDYDASMRDTIDRLNEVKAHECMRCQCIAGQAPNGG